MLFWSLFFGNHTQFFNFRYFGSLFSTCIGTRGLGVHILRDIGVGVLNCCQKLIVLTLVGNNYFF